jgi:hypothetical protein
LFINQEHGQHTATVLLKDAGAVAALLWQKHGNRWIDLSGFAKSCRLNIHQFLRKRSVHGYLVF